MKAKNPLVLRDFQKEDVLFLRKNNYRVLVANAQGTGKTIECLAAIALDRKKLCPVVVVCPASVTFTWFKEARKWCKWAKVHVIRNRRDPLPQTRAHIYIVSWSLFTERFMEIMGIKPKLLIGDEAHFAKNEDAMRSQALYALAQRCPHLLLLTGTPLVNSAQELETLKNIFGTPNPPMLRRLLTDVAPDIPPKTRALLPVYLPPKVAREYRKASDGFSAWLREQLNLRMSAGEAEAAAQRSLAAEALVKIGYLRRIVGRGKVNAAVDFVARAVRVGEPVVLFAEHTQVIRMIIQRLKKQRIGYVAIKGDTPKATRHKSIESFQKGEVPVFIGSKAAATGITLTKARHLVFVERYWTSSEEEQAEDRIRRIGQTHPTKIWFLHASNTVDDRIEELVRRKRRLVHRLVGGEDIDDTPEETAHQIVAMWSKHAGAPVVQGRSLLGLVKSLPPLPDPKETFQLLFNGTRWNVPAVRAWATMNRYPTDNIKPYGKGFKILLTRPSDFVEGSFEVVKIAKDIKIITGKKRPIVGRRQANGARKTAPRPKARPRPLSPTEKLLGGGTPTRWL